MGHSRPLFLFFSSFQYNNVQYKCLPMAVFEPRTSGIGSDRSTNWATTTALASQRSLMTHLTFKTLKLFDECRFEYVRFLHLIFLTVTRFISETRCLNYFNIFGHLQQWKIAKVVSKFCQKLNKPQKNCSKLLNFAQVCEISPNLVTLGFIRSLCSS